MTPTHTNRVAVILGGSRGVGRSVSLHLAQNGVEKLIVIYLDQEDAVQSLIEEVKPLGTTIIPLRYNLGVADEIQSMGRHIHELTDQIDYLIHCVAITTFKPLMQVKPNQWDLTMGVSVRSLLHAVQQLSDLMNAGSSVVAVSSTGSQRYNANYGALGIGKSALESTVRYLAVELGAKGIRVNGVISGLLGGSSLPLFPEIDQVVNETLKRTPMGRLGTSEDVAEAVYFLLTGAFWMTGQHIILDGGYCLT